jgi:hypothetical protein
MLKLFTSPCIAILVSFSSGINPHNTITRVFCVFTATILLLSSIDPKTLSSGSSLQPPARCGAETQYVPLYQLIFHLYVVFLTCSVSRRTAPDIAALLIPSPWYTSGKL